MLDLDGEHVGIRLVMSTDKDKVIMRWQIETTYCEISVVYTNKLHLS